MVVKLELGGGLQRTIKDRLLKVPGVWWPSELTCGVITWMVEFPNCRNQQLHLSGRSPSVVEAYVIGRVSEIFAAVETEALSQRGL